MKKYLLSSLFALAISSFSFGQACTPNWTGAPAGGIDPDTTVNLPHGLINVPYTAVLQFKIPTSDTLGGFPVTITDVTVTGVSGLGAIPASTAFTYATNPANGVFPGGTLGCAIISGTATAAGTYNLTVQANVHVPLTIPYNQGGYRIIIDSAFGAGVDVLKPNMFDVSPNYPNPVLSSTEIAFNTPNSSAVTFDVYNVLGSVVYTSKFTSKAGFNTFSFDASELVNGVYFYKLSDGIHSLTNRMIVAKN